MSAEGAATGVPQDVVPVDCTPVDGCVPAYYIGVQCYEALGGGDCATEGAKSERCYVGGGGVRYHWVEERESGSGGLWDMEVCDDGSSVEEVAREGL